MPLTTSHTSNEHDQQHSEVQFYTTYNTEKQTIGHNLFMYPWLNWDEFCFKFETTQPKVACLRTVLICQLQYNQYHYATEVQGILHF